MTSDTRRPFRLRSERVDLAIHLLEQEVELPAARLGRLRQRAPVLEMAAEPDDFFGDVRAARELRDLLRDGAFVGQRVGPQLLDALRQARLQRRHPVLRRRGGALEQVAEQRAARVEIRAQVPAFASRIRSRSSSAAARAASTRGQALVGVPPPWRDARESTAPAGSAADRRASSARDVAPLARALERAAEGVDERLVDLDVERRRAAAAGR